MEIDFHFIQDQVVDKTLKIRFIPSKDQLANVLTKLLLQLDFNLCVTSSTFMPLIAPEGGC